MNKRIIILIVVILTLLISLSLNAQDKQQLWSEAMNAQDPQIRFDKFQEYESKYGQEQDQNTKFLYLNLTQSAIQLNKYEECITYGEKALLFKDDIKEINLIHIYLFLANAYCLSKKDIDKGLQYCDLVVSLGKKLKNDASVTYNIDKKFIAPALRIEVKAIMDDPSEDPEKLKLAANKAIEAFELDNSRSNIQLLMGIGDKLYKKNLFAESASIFEKINDPQNPNLKFLSFLAQIYDKMGNNAKAIDVLEQSYKIEKKCKTAYNLGILYNKMGNKNKAIYYLAEASQYKNDTKYADKALSTVRHLLFNEINKDTNKTAEELEKEFNQIIEAAKARIKGNLS